MIRAAGRWYQAGVVHYGSVTGQNQYNEPGERQRSLKAIEKSTEKSFVSKLKIGENNQENHISRSTDD